MHLQSTTRTKSPSLSRFLNMILWALNYVYYRGATEVIRCCCPMPLFYLGLNQSTISGTNDLFAGCGFGFDECITQIIQ